jgi:hypothetical protein
MPGVHQILNRTRATLCFYGSWSGLGACRLRLSLRQQTLVWGGAMSEHMMLPNAITGACVSDDPALRAVFLKKFQGKADMFAENMTRAALVWKSPGARVQGNPDNALVWALSYSAVHLHILSMKLLLSGYLIVAGNAFRQVLEGACLSALKSAYAEAILELARDERVEG